MIASLGRIMITCSRCEWYLVEIVVQSGYGPGRKLGWYKATVSLRQPIYRSAIEAKVGHSIDDCLDESLRLNEALRSFRNKMVHGFLGNMHNDEGRMSLHTKATANEPGSRITREEVNDMFAKGDAALSGLKHILLGPYHANGEMD